MQSNKCPLCLAPTHASESNDDGVCRACLGPAAIVDCDHSEWAPACPICCEPHVAIPVGHSETPRKFFVVAFDVTGLTANQINNLAMHVEAQAEASDTAWVGENFEEYPDLSFIVRTKEI